MDPTNLLIGSTTILTVILLGLIIIASSKNGHSTGKKVKHDLHQIKEQINGHHDKLDFIPKKEA
jgi:hypothetical protein